MKKIAGFFSNLFERIWYAFGFGMRTKLIVLFLIVKVVPLVLVTVIAWRQISLLGDHLRDIAVSDSTASLNASAVENIERLSTDTAKRVADFLYSRDSDLLYLAGLEPSEEAYRAFAQAKTGRLLRKEEWVLAEDGSAWVPVEPVATYSNKGGVSTNPENNDLDGYHYRAPEEFNYDIAPYYDEITFVDLEGNELIKVVTDSTKVNHPMDPAKKNISRRENTYIKAEDYFDQVRSMKPGEIYVSDVIGAYTPSNFIGLYTPDNVAKAAADRGYPIEYDPESQSYAGKENPNGTRFEGIVRFATPVADDSGAVMGYVTFALNHDHIMEFVDHITPMNERYTDLPSAYEGNYAFIWDYQCRSICHPRHNSIVGYDPDTGEPEIPWLETSLYEGWQASGLERWTDYVADIPAFDNQSREKKPAPALTQAGLVGLDGRYLNNAPQCTGWMDLTADGGSGSFYILWSGLYKLNTAAAIPYYTGQYAPSEANDFSRRGFGFVAIGAGMDDFTRPAKDTEEKLTVAVEKTLGDTFAQLTSTTLLIVALVVLIAVWIASFLTHSITRLIEGISRFRAGERQFRFNPPILDEFGTLADCFDDMADSIVDSVKNPLCITDMDLKVIYMNDEGLAYRRRTLEEMTGTHYGDDSVYPLGSRYCPITALKEGREADIYYYADRDRYIRGSASYFLGRDGQRRGYMILTTDVTDMVLEQLKIEEQRTLLDKIFSASPDLIWYQDAKGAYMTVNPRYASIAGVDPEDFVGKTAGDLLPPAVAGEAAERDRKAMEGSAPLYTEETMPFADGHEETLDSVRTPILDSNGALVGLLGYARDVSARVRIETALRETQLELEQAVTDANLANQHKGDFLARMSHEIRTPMNAIIGLAAIVQRKLDAGPPAGNDLGEVKDHVRQIEASSQHLLGLLNDILDISKIEAGKIELVEDRMELPKLLSTVCGIIQPRCDEKNITFATFIDAFSPSVFRGDSLRLRQVLINLMGNAVKFTPELGRIEFRVEALDRADGKTLVGFSVRDTGIGISQEEHGTIFQPFEQARRNRSGQAGGTGLGLAISRKIVQLFGGDIELRSQVGEGSEFRFQIWLTELAEEAPREERSRDVTGRFAGKRALLVDDVDINRMIVKSLLEITGIETDEAVDGVDALEKFRASREGYYDIVFMDVQMPNMDGYEAAMAIRALERSDVASLPIITLTANAFQDDIDKALRHGMDAHISKPVEMERLAEVLFMFLEEE